MQNFTYPTFPENCVLLEWSEDQQSTHFNEVKKGRPEIRLNTSSYCVIHVCQNHDEAYLIARYIEDVIVGTTTRNRRVLTTRQAIKHVKEMVKFSKAYHRVLSKATKPISKIV